MTDQLKKRVSGHSQKMAAMNDTFNAFVCLTGHPSLRKIDSFDSEMKRRRNVLIMELTDKIGELINYLETKDQHPFLIAKFSHRILGYSEKDHLSSWNTKTLKLIYDLFCTKVTAFIAELMQKFPYDKGCLQLWLERFTIMSNILYHL